MILSRAVAAPLALKTGRTTGSSALLLVPVVLGRGGVSIRRLHHLLAYCPSRSYRSNGALPRWSEVFPSVAYRKKSTFTSLATTRSTTTGGSTTDRAASSAGGAIIRKRSSRTMTSCLRNKNHDTKNPLHPAIFQWYGEKLETHPILTKGLTAGFIGAMGDVLCQVFIDKPELVLAKEQQQQQQKEGETIVPERELSALWWFDAGRSARFLVLGVGLVGPWCHAWFGWLARTFPQLTPSSIMTRVALDQFAFTPIILSTFISSLWTLEDFMKGYDDATTTSFEADEASNKNKDENKKSLTTRLQETVPELLVANWILWGPAQLINFRLVPQKFQVLFANMISLVWTGYLSFSTRSEASIPVDAATDERIVNEAPLPVGAIRRMTRRVTDQIRQHQEDDDDDDGGDDHTVIPTTPPAPTSRTNNQR